MALIDDIKNDKLKKIIIVKINYKEKPSKELKSLYISNFVCNVFKDFNDENDLLTPEPRLKKLPLFEKQIDVINNNVVWKGGYSLVIENNDSFYNDIIVNNFFKEQKVEIYLSTENSYEYLKIMDGTIKSISLDKEIKLDLDESNHYQKVFPKKEIVNENFDEATYKNTLIGKFLDKKVLNINPKNLNDDFTNINMSCDLKADLGGNYLEFSTEEEAKKFREICGIDDKVKTRNTNGEEVIWVVEENTSLTSDVQKNENLMRFEQYKKKTFGPITTSTSNKTWTAYVQSFASAGGNQISTRESGVLHSLVPGDKIIVGKRGFLDTANLYEILSINYTTGTITLTSNLLTNINEEFEVIRVPAESDLGSGVIAYNDSLNVVRVKKDDEDLIKNRSLATDTVDLFVKFDDSVSYNNKYFVSANQESIALECNLLENAMSTTKFFIVSEEWSWLEEGDIIHVEYTGNDEGSDRSEDFTVQQFIKSPLSGNRIQVKETIASDKNKNDYIVKFYKVNSLKIKDANKEYTIANRRKSFRIKTDSADKILDRKEYGRIQIGDLIFTQKTAGANGNEIIFVDDAALNSESITLSGNTYTVHMNALKTTGTTYDKYDKPVYTPTTGTTATKIKNMFDALGGSVPFTVSVVSGKGSVRQTTGRGIISNGYAYTLSLLLTGCKVSNLNINQVRTSVIYFNVNNALSSVSESDNYSTFSCVVDSTDNAVQVATKLKNFLNTITFITGFQAVQILGEGAAPTDEILVKEIFMNKVPGEFQLLNNIGNEITKQNNFEIFDVKNHNLIYELELNDGDLTLNIDRKTLNLQNKSYTLKDEFDSMLQFGIKNEYINNAGKIKLLKSDDVIFYVQTPAFFKVGDVIQIGRNWTKVIGVFSNYIRVNFVSPLEAFSTQTEITKTKFESENFDLTKGDTLYVSRQHSNGDIYNNLANVYYSSEGNIITTHSNSQESETDYNYNFVKVKVFQFIEIEDVFINYKDEHSKLGNVIKRLFDLYNVSYNTQDLEYLTEEHGDIYAFVDINNSENLKKDLEELLVSFNLNSFIDSEGDIRIKFFNSYDVNNVKKIDYFDVIDTKKDFTFYDYTQVKYNFNLRNELYESTIVENAEYDEYATVKNVNEKEISTNLIVKDFESKEYKSKLYTDIFSSKYFKNQEVLEVFGSISFFEFDLFDIIEFTNTEEFSGNYIITKFKTDGSLVQLTLLKI